MSGPRVVVVGGLHPRGKPSETMGEPGPLYAHSICGATYGIAAALSQHGYDAVPWEGWSAGPIKADALFVSERNFFDGIVRNKLWDLSKPCVVWLHDASPGNTFTEKDLAKVTAGICFTRREALLLFASQAGPHPRHPYWVAPWGFPTWWTMPPVTPNPYPPGTKNIVYAGRIEPGGRIRDIISHVARRFPDVGIWIITDCVVPDIRNELTSFPNVTWLGALCHGTFLHYLYYADLALDTGIVTARRANNCKLWDYLACGVPVIMDGTTGGDDLVLYTGNGAIVPARDYEAYLDAVERGLSGQFTREQRDTTIRYMKENWTWEAVVRRWVGHFQEVIPPCA
ncbi:MAG: glycosyltransferase [Candidatus Thermoplasmatota archaeon]|nr:glycosyltransferase [Candidatus Thermoplasmatota archaeon]